MVDNKDNTELVEESASGHELRKMRSIVFHILYAWDAFEYDCSLESIVDNFNKEFDLDVPLDGEIVHIVSEVVKHEKIVNDEIKPLLENWTLERVGCCTRLILRYACWEILYTDMPVNIVINEVYRDLYGVNQ